MPGDLVIVMDCGSTNVTVAAVDDRGDLIGYAGYPNAPVRQPEGPEGWLIWDLDKVWRKLCDACQQVCARVGRERIRAVTLTTFGADGAPVRNDGTLTYPVICWQDPRTEALAREFRQEMDFWEVFVETGYQVIPFNTLFKLKWLQRYVPEDIEQANCWLMMPGLLNFKLCGEFSIDPTIGGTTMAMDIGWRDWSEKMLTFAGVGRSFFPDWAEPGVVVGKVLQKASVESGLPARIPVVAAGHDTQFAAIGSGAAVGEAILSSGTWEILMVRADRFRPNRFGFEEGLLYEPDALKGFWDPQLLMMGSGVLEWVRSHFYGAVDDREEAYRRMIAEAQSVDAGAGGVTFVPSFVSETGPTRKHHTCGTILGLSLATSRGQVYRAALEGLSFQLRQALDILSKATDYKINGVRVVGGGSKNRLWNQIRADVTGLPVTTIARKEATVIGAALFAFTGAGIFGSVGEGLARFRLSEATLEPSGTRTLYEDLFAKYIRLPRALEGFYSLRS